jgi:hypothetical protein
MTIRQVFRNHRRSPALALLALNLALLSGCVPDQDYTPVVTQFRQSANTLAHAFQMLLANANAIEYEHYIDTQAFDRGPLTPNEIAGHAVITPEELKLRSDAVLAIAEYTNTLAILAQGKEEARIAYDANAASTCFSTLATDAQATAANRHLIPTTADYAGPISDAAGAAGEILGLIERHRTHEEIRNSIAKNDPALTALFNLLGSESNAIYERQKSTQRAQGVLLFADYNREIAQPTPDKDYLLQLSDRIKQFRRNQALVAQSDPAAAIAAFKNSHDALVAVILAPKSTRSQSLTELVASVKAFADEVQPLSASVQAPATTR